MHYLSLLVKPYAKVTARTGSSVDLMGNTIYMCSLKAPAHEGEANAALIAFVAESLKLPKVRVRIVKGQKGRHKIIAIDAEQDTLDFSLLTQ